MEQEKFVFVPNLPMRFDQATQQKIPAIDINAASRFGELVIITKGTFTEGAEIQTAIGKVRERIRIEQDGENYQDGDYILAVGNIIVLAAAIMQAARSSPVVRVVHWDNKQKSYRIIKIDLGDYE